MPHIHNECHVTLKAKIGILLVGGTTNCISYENVFLFRLL